jgi:hypothetical protein
MGEDMCLRCLLFLGVLLVYCGYAAAEQQSPAGYISATRGEVYAIDSQGVIRDLKVKDPVALDDFIVTEEKGRVKIVFQDTTIVTLGENSRIQLNDYSWSKNRNQGKFKITVNEGLFRIIGGKITRTNPESFIARTPAASIGIRGSSYAGSVSGKGLAVFLLGGRGIDVSNNKGSVALLQPGMGTSVASADVAPETPRHFNAAEINYIESGSAMEGDLSSGGSTIGPNARIINQATISNSVNLAIGKDNTARMGSIGIKNSKVDGTVVNQATIKNSANISVGTGNKATTGSIDIE